MSARASTCTLYPTRMSWKGQLTWIFRKATFKDAEDVDTSFASYTRPGCPGRVGRPGFPGRSPYATRRAFTRPSRHLHPTRMSWKGGPTWISRKVIPCDAKGGDSPLASLTPDQDVLEGWADLDFQEGHLMRREGRSHVLRVTYTRPGCPGRVGRPGFPGRSSHATRRAVIRPSRHPHPTRMSWKGGPTWISRKVTLCDAKGGDSPLASLTPDQDVLEGWADLDVQEGYLQRRGRR